MIGLLKDQIAADMAEVLVLVNIHYMIGICYNWVYNESNTT